MKQIYLILCLAFIIASCGESEKQKSERLGKDSIRKVDSIKMTYKPLAEMRDTMIDRIKELLKAPGSAHFSTLDGDSIIFSGNARHDTVTVYGIKVLSLPDSSWVHVTVPYEAQNSYGVYLPGAYEGSFQKVNGKWRYKQWASLSLLDVWIIYKSELLKYKDWKATHSS